MFADFRVFIYFRLGRTAEFLIYGHGQQRRAIIEAFRLYDNQKRDEENHEKQQSSRTIESFKERSRKWEKFVTQVSICTFFKSTYFMIQISSALLLMTF